MKKLRKFQYWARKKVFSGPILKLSFFMISVAKFS